MSLYFLLILIIFPAFTISKVDFPPDLQEMLDNLHIDCLKDQGLSEDDFKTFDINKKDSKMMCYMRCLFIQAKWMNTGEALQYDYIKENVHHAVRHITLPELENCGKKAEEGGKCEKAYNFYFCMHLAEPEDWVLV